MKKSIYCFLVLLFVSCGSLTLTSATPALAASNGLSGEEKLERVLLHHQKAREKALEYQATEGRPAQQLAPELPFPLVGTYTMQSDTGEGIRYLAWDGAYLWGLDGPGFLQPVYVVKIDPSNFSILDSFEAPTEDPAWPGADGIAYANGYLWILNYLDDCIYAVDPATKLLVKKIYLPLTGDIYSGLCFDGKYLYFLEWGPPLKLYRLDPEDPTTPPEQVSLPGYEYGNDLTYRHGSLWITALDTSFYPYLLELDPVSGAVLHAYHWDYCVWGITFIGKHLIAADWFYLLYYKYDTERRITSAPGGGGDGCFIGAILT